MLSKFPDRAFTFFAIDYDLQLGKRLDCAVDSITDAFLPKRVGLGAQVFDFQWPEKGFHAVLSPKRIAIETLGLDAWTSNRAEHLRLVKSALQELKLTSLKRIGFKVLGYLPLGISHSEMIDLMFGSFLMPRELLSPIIDGTLDPLIHFESKDGELKYTLDISAMSAEQAANSVLAMPNADHYCPAIARMIFANL